MSDDLNPVLSRAFELIEAGNYDEARELLEPVLQRERNDPDVWWIYSYSVKDLSSARVALENVIRLDPNYPGAQEMLAKLNEHEAKTTATQPAKPAIKPLSAAATKETAPAPQPAPEPDFVFDLDDEPAPSVEGVGERQTSEAREERIRQLEERVATQRAERRGGSPWLMRIVALLVIVLLIGGALFVLQNQTPAPEEAAATTLPTLDVVAVPTTDAAAAAAETPVEPTPTAETVTDQATAQSVLPVSGSMRAEDAGIDTSAAAAGLSPAVTLADPAFILETNAGVSTLYAAVCTSAGRPLRTDVPNAMYALGKQAAGFIGEANNLGVRAVDCAGGGNVLLSLTTNINIALAYAEGALSDTEFAAVWRSQ